MSAIPLPGKPTEPGLYLQTWCGRTAKVRVERLDPDRLVWYHVSRQGEGYAHEMDTIDGETWERIIEFPQAEVITWQDGMPPDGEIVLALFRGDEGVTLARWEGDVCTVVSGGEWECVDPSTLICWAHRPKGPR